MPGRLGVVAASPARPAVSGNRALGTPASFSGHAEQGACPARRLLCPVHRHVPGVAPVGQSQHCSWPLAVMCRVLGGIAPGFALPLQRHLSAFASSPRRPLQRGLVPAPTPPVQSGTYFHCRGAVGSTLRQPAVTVHPVVSTQRCALLLLLPLRQHAVCEDPVQCTTPPHRKSPLHVLHPRQQQRVSAYNHRVLVGSWPSPALALFGPPAKDPRYPAPFGSTRHQQATSVDAACHVLPGFAY
mmetsp:Transcript_109661/g.217766  ORF Transcript_109661/g.217766 Transcript_109661/m.217766 type:complete len:242 (+) Transcript_109661:3655-4380(+)